MDSALLHANPMQRGAHWMQEQLQQVLQGNSEQKQSVQNDVIALAAGVAAGRRAFAVQSIRCPGSVALQTRWACLAAGARTAAALPAPACMPCGNVHAAYYAPAIAWTVCCCQRSWFGQHLAPSAAWTQRVSAGEPSWAQRVSAGAALQARHPAAHLLPYCSAPEGKAVLPAGRPVVSALQIDPLLVHCGTGHGRCLRRMPARTVLKARAPCNKTYHARLGTL